MAALDCVRPRGISRRGCVCRPRHEDRVVAKTAIAARRHGDAPSQVPSPTSGAGSSASATKTIDAAIARGALRGGHAASSRSSLRDSVRRSRPRRRSARNRAPAGRPAHRLRCPESSAIAGRPVRRAALRALISAFSRKVLPVSGGGSMPKSDWRTSSRPVRLTTLKTGATCPDCRWRAPRAGPA